MVERLLTDGTSPLNRNSVGGAVALEVHTALDCMVGEHTSTAISVQAPPIHNALDPR
jgi:hypothetical protein